MTEHDPQFVYTLYPDGRVRTLIVDGTHWVSVATANAQEDRARADERKKIVKYLVDMGYEGAAFLLTSGESNA